MTTHHVLWTGGWDSTFRVVDLVLTYRRTVRPIYVFDPGRLSTRVELSTMSRWRRAIRRIDLDAAARVGPLERYRLADIRHEPAVTRSWERLRSSAHLGSQYDWLARLAGQLDVVVELAIHRDDRAAAFLDNHVARSDASPPDDVWRLDGGAGSDLWLFQRFVLPLFETTKLEMGEIAVARGFGGILEKTWFCHTPTLFGRPCGFCNSCCYTRDEGLARRVPEPTARRQRWRQRKKRL